MRLITPTSDNQRLPTILASASGFVYYVTVTGITGTASATANSISAAYQRIRKQTDLPIVTGFGIRTHEQAAEFAASSDGAVVGSAVVDIIASNIAQASTGDPADARDKIVRKVTAFVGGLSSALRN